MRKILILFFLISTAYGKIYDCFLFFNEWEILELRLNELYDYVDKFVIVEASEGFRGHPKPFNFELKKDRYSKFADKIIYIKLKTHIKTDNSWVREYWQRNQIMRGLTNCAPNDLILISDVDEYLPGAELQHIYFATGFSPILGFRQKMYRWFLNRDACEMWAGSVAIRYKYLRLKSPQELRDLARSEKIRMWTCGWHFTSMGGYDRIEEKYRHFSHGSDEVISYEEWRSQVNAHPLVEIDSSYPKFIQENIAYLTELGLIDPQKSSKSR